MSEFVTLECKYCGNSDRSTFIIRESEYICKCCGRCYRESASGGETRIVMGFEMLKNYDFSSAENIFSDIISEYPESIDARWGLLLARYGIVFVKGFYMGEIEPIYCFPNYAYNKGTFKDEAEYREIENLLAKDLNKNAKTLEMYREQAKQIESALEIFKNDVGKKENDIFICVKISKTTASNPELKGTTVDYEKACELYGKLREEGKRVFFSYVTLKNTIDSDMEIWRNMLKSKKMLLIGSRTEYMNSVWVKSEWERWLYLDNAGGDEHRKNFYVYVLGNEKTEDLYAKLPGGLKRLRLQIYTESKEEELIKDLCGGKTGRNTKPEKPAAADAPKLAKKPKGKSGYVELLNGKREEIPFGLESAADYSGRNDIVKAVLPKSITKITKSNFSGCINLESIEIPKGVTQIEAGAFSGCSKLASVELPDGITEIEPQTFYMCKNLAKVKLPKELESIGAGAFMLCGSLKKIEFPSGLLSIGDEAFHSSGLHEVEVPKAVLRIGERVFAVCKKLRKVVLCDTITSIGKDAFDKKQKIIYHGEKEDFDRANKDGTKYSNIVCQRDASVKSHRGMIAFSIFMLPVMIAACAAILIYVPGSLHWCIAIGGGLLIAGIGNIISINAKNSTYSWLNIIYIVACAFLFISAMLNGTSYTDPETNDTIYQNTVLSANLSIYIIGLAASALVTGIYNAIIIKKNLSVLILAVINLFEVAIGVLALIFSAWNVVIVAIGLVLVVAISIGFTYLVARILG